MLKSIISTFVILVAGASVFLMGAVSMTGVDLSLPVNIIEFIVTNGLILIGIIAALRQVWSKKSHSDVPE